MFRDPDPDLTFAMINFTKCKEETDSDHTTVISEVNRMKNIKSFMAFPRLSDNYSTMTVVLVMHRYIIATTELEALGRTWFGWLMIAMVGVAI